MSEDDIDKFVWQLTEFLNPRLPPEKHMGNFFDTDEQYLPLNEFCVNWFEPFYTKERNFN